VLKRELNTKLAIQRREMADALIENDKKLISGPKLQILKTKARAAALAAAIAAKKTTVAGTPQEEK
jgi:hypothetical protein